MITAQHFLKPQGLEKKGSCYAGYLEDQGVETIIVLFKINKRVDKGIVGAGFGVFQLIPFSPCLCTARHWLPDSPLCCEDTLFLHWLGHPSAGTHVFISGPPICHNPGALAWARRGGWHPRRAWRVLPRYPGKQLSATHITCTPSTYTTVYVDCISIKRGKYLRADGTRWQVLERVCQGARASPVPTN